MSYQTGPRGRSYIRVKATQFSGDEAGGFALTRWGQQGPGITRAATSAIQTGDLGQQEALEFFNTVYEDSVVGAMSSATRSAAFNKRMIAHTSAYNASFVAEGAPAPVLKTDLAGSMLAPRKVIAIIPTTKEAMLLESPAVESGVQADLEAGCVGALDISFLNPANAGSDAAPAAVTHGAPTVAATGDAPADLKALVSVFNGNLATSWLVTDPDTATGLAMVRGPNGSFLFPDLGPRGGSILGIPVLTTRHSPLDSSGGIISLIDASAIAVAADGIEVSTSEVTSIMMSDTPTSPAEMVSMFQTNTVALRAVLYANWEVQGTGRVAVLTGANY